MTEPTPTTADDIALRRRGLLRGGALAAVAAGAVVVGTARPAAAINGETVTVGGNFDGTERTILHISPASRTTPALELQNDDGPSLALQALAPDWDGQLGIGQFLGTTEGPLVGVDAGDGSAATVYLATGFDLALLATPVPQDPFRYLDTRNAAGRRFIRQQSSSKALDSSGRLKEGQWIDVGVAPADDPSGSVEAVFANVTVTDPLAGGHLVLHPAGTARPKASTINFGKGATIANGTFVGVGLVEDVFAVRIYTTATTHVLLDVTGQTVNGFPGPAASTARSRSAARAARRARATARRTVRAR